MTSNEIKAKILVDDRWLIRGLLAIFQFQTESEKSIEATTDHNDVGFNGVDGRILTSFAKFYQKRGFLSPKQLHLTRKKMLKYCGQLQKIAERKAKSTCP